MPARVLAALAACAAAVTTLQGTAAEPVSAYPMTGHRQEQRARFDTRLLARIPTPGFPALGYVHPDGRIYAGTYVNPDAIGVPSRVFELTGDGRLSRSFVVPGQDTSGEHGVQVTTSDAQGDLVILDRSPPRALKLDRETGGFSAYATFADLKPCPPGGAATTCSPTAADEPAVPNFGAWGRDGSLYVTDFLQGVVWRVPPGGGAAEVWLSDRRLDGGMFGTTGIALAADGTTLLVAQGSSGGGSGVLTSPNPTTGKLYAVAIGADGAPGELRQLYESRPGDLPDGFAIAASGRIYVPLVGLPQQIAVLAPDGTEIERFPREPGSGANGSEVPFDSPSSVRFLGTRLIVANQSAIAGDPNNQALLDLEAGEAGLPEMIPGLDLMTPEVRRVTVSRERFAPAPRGGKPRPPRRGRPALATRLRLGLTEPATVDIRVARSTPQGGTGKGGGGRWQQRDVFERTLPRGRHGIVFRGRIRDGERVRALKPGRFRFSIRVTDRSGNRSVSADPSGRAFREFTVLRRARRD